MDKIGVFRMDLEWNKSKEYWFSGITGMKDANKLGFEICYTILTKCTFLVITFSL
jgi:hypothetical protein